MLPKPRRLKKSDDFGNAVRRGSRAATPSVVVHMVRRTDQDPSAETRVGFVVSKKVGNAVTRNRVKRRLRHLALAYFEPQGYDVVVRALPSAATNPEGVAADFASAWRRACRKATAC